MTKERYEHRSCFESYGVRVMIESNSLEILEQAVGTARTALLDRVKFLGKERAELSFRFYLAENGICTLFQNDEKITEDLPEYRFWKFFNGLTRIIVAEHAKSVVFVHAGAVGWRQKAIVIPGNSFHGKSRLVAEFVRIGADYYSDEYAIFDENGLVSPYPRPIAMRPDSGPIFETPVTAEELGGRTGTEAIPVGCVLFAKYEANSIWKPQLLSPGTAVLDIIPQTISIKRNTEFAIKVLKKGITNAIIVKSSRSDAADFAKMFLEFVDNTAF